MLEKSNIFKLDGAPLYSPSGCTCQTIPIHHEDSGTDENEDMHLIVKGFRRKCTLAYETITGAELRDIFRMMIKKVNYYQLTYKDPLLGVTSMEVYIPDYTVEVLSYALGSTQDDGVYTGLTIEFIGSRMMDY